MKPNRSPKYNPFLLLALVGLLTACGQLRTEEEETVTDRKVWPEKYTYTFDSTLTENDNFFAGYMDSFSVGGTPFRILYAPSDEGELDMQYHFNNKWTSNFKAWYGFHGYDRKTDINLDGYADFQYFAALTAQANLFNDSTHQYDKYSFRLSLQYGVLDAAKKIFYNLYWEHEQDFKSDVLIYKNRRPYYLYQIVRYNPQLTRLYRCNAGKLNDTTAIRDLQIASPISLANFDRYWKEQQLNLE